MYSQRVPQTRTGPAAPGKSSTAHECGARAVPAPVPRAPRSGDGQAPVPAAWKRSPPSSSMRLAQFQVPAAPGSGPAAFIVYYFGPGQGGSASANIARWTGQFSAPGGGAATPEVSRRETSGMPVTVVRLQGDYARGVGTGPVGTARPDQVLRAAIIESSRGNVIVQLHGPAATVDAAAADFDRFVAGIR